VQDDISRSITQALRITLTAREQRAIEQKPTENLEAYDFYLRGRDYTHRENLQFAIQMFENAIRLDPGFALAHVGSRTFAEEFSSCTNANRNGWNADGRRANERCCWIRICRMDWLRGRGFTMLKENMKTRCCTRARRWKQKHNCEDAYNILGRSLLNSDRLDEAAAIADARWK